MNGRLDDDEDTTKDSAWTRVGNKKSPTKKKSATSAKVAGDGIGGATKASRFVPLGLAPPVRDTKAEAAKRREEREKKFNTGRKVNPLPEALSPNARRDSSSDEDGESLGAEEESDSTSITQGTPKQQAAKVEKKKSSTATVPPDMKQGLALQEALRKIDYKALSAEIMTTKTAQSNDAWIRLVADRLNQKLSAIPVEQNFYSEKGFVWGYPLNVAPRELTDFLFGVFHSCAQKFLEAYFNYCVMDACRSFISQRKATHGSRLIVQYLVSSNPSLISEKSLNERVSEVRSYQSRKEEMLWIMWAYGQAGVGSFGEGFKVWYKLMFPLINSRGYTEFCVVFLDRLLTHHKKQDFVDINQQEVFLNIFDGFLGTNSHSFQPRAIKAKIPQLYNRIRNLVFKKDLKQTAIDYFPQFLMRLSLQPSDEYKKAACENMMLCLKADGKCLDFWLEKHPSSQRDSQVLLDYIAENDEPFTRKLRHWNKFHRFLDSVEEIQPTKSKSPGAQVFRTDLAQTKDVIKKVKDRIRVERKKVQRRRIGIFVMFLLTLITGEIIFQGPQNSIVLQTWRAAKPRLWDLWMKTLPILIYAWQHVITPTTTWIYNQTVTTVTYLSTELPKVPLALKTNVPGVYSALLSAQLYLEDLWKTISLLLYRGVRQLDGWMMGFPPLSYFIGLLAPFFKLLSEGVWHVLGLLQPFYDSAVTLIQQQASNWSQSEAPEFKTA